MTARKKLLLTVASLTLVSGVACYALLRWQVSDLIESEIGAQMVVQAEIAAHLVELAESKGTSSGDLNDCLHRIATSVRAKVARHRDRAWRYEFWITDGEGRAYLRSLPRDEYPGDFIFSTDQAQARAFLPLLNDSERRGYGPHEEVVIQDVRRREITPELYKYAGVGGVDRSRIVQVGYEATPLKSHLRNGALFIAFLMLGVQFGFMLLVLVAHHFALAPLSRLTRITSDLIGKNQYDEGTIRNLSSWRDGETRPLALAVRELARQIQRRQEQIEELQREADQDGRIVLWLDEGANTIADCNQTALTFFDFKREELIGRHMNVIIPPESRQEVKGVVESLSASGEVGDKESDNFNANMKKGGGRCWIHWRNRWIRRDDGSRRLLCVGADLSGLLREDGTLDQRMMEVLRFAQQMQGVADSVQNMRLFLSNTAHELRRPLQAISLCVELLLETPLDQGQRQDLLVLAGQARLLRHNIESLLALAKIEKGQLDLEHKPFSLRATLDEVVTALAYNAEERGGS
jgi:PAS domain S-box-containing protein